MELSGRSIWLRKIEADKVTDLSESPVGHLSAIFSVFTFPSPFRSTAQFIDANYLFRQFIISRIAHIYGTCFRFRFQN